MYFLIFDPNIIDTPIGFVARLTWQTGCSRSACKPHGKCFATVHKLWLSTGQPPRQHWPTAPRERMYPFPATTLGPRLRTCLQYRDGNKPPFSPCSNIVI
eukprot:2571042-Amphidinium_carterae.1